jgi:peptidoglycan hydrolase-like protein with peptidoglycan-binding domain
LRIIAALLLAFCLSGTGFALQPKKRPTHTAQKKKGRRRAAPKNLAQTAPTPERYQEIERALVAKGYGPQAPTGVWGPEWASALKHYQQDQKLEPTGKLNSLSLITLGLGPKREPPAGVTAPPAPPADQPSSSSSTVREPK